MLKPRSHAVQEKFNSVSMFTFETKHAANLYLKHRSCVLRVNYEHTFYLTTSLSKQGTCWKPASSHIVIIVLHLPIP